MKIIIVLLLAVTLLTSCAKQVEHKYTLYVFGTLVEFTLYNIDRVTGDKAIAVVSDGFQQRHRDWHAWKKKGQLFELNKAIRNGYPLKIDAQMKQVLTQARDFERISHGLFNPAIGRLIALWGFHSDDKPKGPPPNREKIARLVKAHPSMEDIVLKNNLAIPHNKTVQLDFGGFAKGTALDWAAGVLKNFGIKNAIINAGGDLNVMGRHGKRLWRIGIRHPKHWGVIASVNLQPGEALYTSGNYYRFKEYEGVRYSHILDPRTGWPVDHIVSASVIHKNGALADAAATALSVAGPRHWLETARNMGLTQILLVDKNGGLYMTPKMKQRLSISDPAARIVEISDPFKH
jgi:thiamine biosynthesis lipoprotein